MRRLPARPSARQRNPEAMYPFEWPIIVPHVRDIPGECRCTWVPRPRGFGLPAVQAEAEADPRQPWLT